MGLESRDKIMDLGNRKPRIPGLLRVGGGVDLAEVGLIVPFL